MKPIYRIKEFIIPDDNKNRFAIEEGTVYRTTGFLGFPSKRIDWNDIKNAYGITLKFKTMKDALKEIESLKEQQPIYHTIK